MRKPAQPKKETRPAVALTPELRDMLNAIVEAAKLDGVTLDKQDIACEAMMGNPSFRRRAKDAQAALEQHERTLEAGRRAISGEGN